MIAPQIAGHHRLQRSRDPADVRYWSRAEGGQGFRHPNDTRPSRQYSALRTYDDSRHLMSDDTATTSIVDATQDYTPDTVRSRARAALVLAIKRASDTLADDANELKLNELAPTMAALGRISGVQLEEQRTGDIRIHIVRDTLPPEPQRIAIASPLAPREADGVSVCDATVYDDDGEAQG